MKKGIDLLIFNLKKYNGYPTKARRDRKVTYKQILRGFVLVGLLFILVVLLMCGCGGNVKHDYKVGDRVLVESHSPFGDCYESEIVEMTDNGLYVKLMGNSSVHTIYRDSETAIQQHSTYWTKVFNLKGRVKED